MTETLTTTEQTADLRPSDPDFAEQLATLRQTVADLNAQIGQLEARRDAVAVRISRMSADKLLYDIERNARQTVTA